MYTTDPVTNTPVSTSLTTYADDLARFMLFHDIADYQFHHNSNDVYLDICLKPLGMTQSKLKNKSLRALI